MGDRPYIVVIGGPNGAGKSTIAKAVLDETFGVKEFVNADTIASGLSGFSPERVAFAAGRVMLARLRELAELRATFAFESTLASRTFVPWLVTQIDRQYDIHLVYVALSSARLAIRRVQRRVRLGGHAVPPEVVTRRFHRSARNFLKMYVPLATTWRIYNNSGGSPTLAATGGNAHPTLVHEPRTWRALHEAANQASQDQPSGGGDDAHGQGD